MSSSLLRDNIRALKNWRVWLHLGLADIRNRFAKSMVGPIWIVLNLALWVGGIGVIYSALFHQELHDFLPKLTIGFVVWGYLTQTLTDGGNAFIYAEGYIKQFTYPKQIYILRVLVNASVVLLIGVLVFFAVMLLFQRPFGWGMLWALPGFAILALAAYLHATIMAYASVRFRDLPHGMTSLLQVMFLVTPVFPTVGILNERGLGFVYEFNPFYYLIEVIRCPLVDSVAAAGTIYVASGIYLLLIGAVALVTAKVFDRRIVYIL